MTEREKGDLSVRNAAILQILCDEYKMMPENGAVPSLRKIKSRFNIGSATAELIQKKLCDHFSIPHSQRKKIRKPVSQPKQIVSLKHSSGDCVLCIASDTGYFWQSYIQEYNQNHKNHILVKYLPYMQNFIRELKNQTSDFFLFPTDPFFLEIVQNTDKFMDLSPAVKDLDKSQYYQTIFHHSPDGKLWGIGANNSIDVLCSHKELCRLPRFMNTWDEFIDILREVRRRHEKNGIMPFIFSSYYAVMQTFGLQVLDENSMFRSDPAIYEESIEMMQLLIKDKLVPFVSNSRQPSSDAISLFHDKKIAVRMFNLPRISLDSIPEYDITPVPVKYPDRRKVISEMFTVSNMTMNYEHAWNFIRFILSRKTQKAMTGSLRLFPAMKKLYPALYTRPQSIQIESALNGVDQTQMINRFTGGHIHLFDSIMDRYFKYGGNLSKMLKEIEREYNNYWFI